MIAGLAHFAEWIFWVALTAFILIAIFTVVNSAIGWASARVVRKPRPVVNFDQRRRAHLQALLREEPPAHADEWQTIGIGVDESKRDAALHLIMHGERR